MYGIALKTVSNFVDKRRSQISQTTQPVLYYFVLGVMVMLTVGDETQYRAGNQAAFARHSKTLNTSLHLLPRGL